MYYKKCPKCGASLDLCEKCDCSKDKPEPQVKKPEYKVTAKDIKAIFNELGIQLTV